MISFPFDSVKFTELVLYIALRSETDRSFGATKLNKLLYYCDFFTYSQFGEPISGATYRRLERGPAPRELVATLEQLEGAEEAIVVERDHFGHTQRRLIPRRRPRLDVFTAQEIALVDAVISELWDHSANDVSQLSHHEAGWQLAGDREDIPYESVFISSDSLTPADVQRAERVAADLGWLADE